MRQRLQAYLPVFLLALVIQILAPIAGSWATALAVSDPIAAAEICHSGAATTADSDAGGPQANGSTCAICCIAQASATLTAPATDAVVSPYRASTGVVWRLLGFDPPSALARSGAQPRAPPIAS